VTRHLLSVSDLSSEQVADVLRHASVLSPPQVLAGKGAALVFEHPSARTRNAAEMAVTALGGHPVTIRGDEVGIDQRESAEDVARTLACFHSTIAARVERHTTLERMVAALDAAGVEVPVVNLLSDREHPTQALADLLTIQQRLGSLEGKTLAFIGDANNVCRSLVGAAALTGMSMRVASPPAYELGEADLAWGGSLGDPPVVCGRPEEAAEGADVLYTDVWVSMGQDEEAWVRRRAFAGYTIDETLLALAAPGAIVLHCLPAHRGEEISAGMMDSPQSAVWQQAENRLHSIRGLLLHLLGPAEAS
jgi:ornithine carbamoyltransferase